MRTGPTFWRDERGNSAIEMALVLPLLATLLIGMVDLSGGYAVKVTVQQAAQRAIEKVMQTTASKTVIETLKSEAAAGAGVAESAVTVDYWLECNGARQAIYDNPCPSGQTYARYLSVEVAKVYDPTLSFKFIGANADGTFTIRSKAGLRTQ